MNVPLLSFSLISRNRRKKSASAKKAAFAPPTVFANEYDDSSTEDMIRQCRRKPGHPKKHSYDQQISEQMIPIGPKIRQH